MALALLALCALGTARRLQVTQEYRNFAGDGWQYYHLAQNLVGEGHRYAFGPPPQPLAWSRLPGYPLWMAAVGLGAPKFNEADVGLRVARSQAILDGLSSILAFLVAWELGLRAAPWLAAVLCLLSPLLALCTTYLLTESLAVLLTTAVLWLLLRASRARIALHLALAGVGLGLATLVRADSILLAPLFVVPLLRSPERAKDRLRAALLAVACAAAVFSPWPLRNWVRFKSPHPLGSAWVNRFGDPLPTGVQRWLLTWAVEPREAADVAWRMTRATPLSAAALPAAAVDSPAERQRVGDLLEAYNRAGAITAAVDRGFEALAGERRTRSWRRYYLTLPWQRARELWWKPVPEWEMPAQSATLGLPEDRDRLRILGHRALFLAAVGLLIVPLWSGAGRTLALLLALAALLRTVAVVFLVAGGTQRYVVELLPLLLVLTAVALLAPVELAIRRWVRRR